MTSTPDPILSNPPLLLEPNTLWDRLRAQTQYALQCGALQPIPTDCELVEEEGISFEVRIVSNLARKEREKKKQQRKTAETAKEFNPFLPYEKDLFVADISETHLCLLNKFNVVEHHLLIVTRSFEEQDSWLKQPDFAALLACMAQVDGLAFYNGGTIAGASQRHKHLQLIPLPLANHGNLLPIETAIASATFEGSVGRIPGFPFQHAMGKLHRHWANSPLEASEATLECYHSLLEAVGLEVRGDRPTGPYNLLATKDWMLVVPRSAECFESISVNSLGFAGALLVKNEQELQQLKDKGPMEILKSVAVSNKDFSPATI